MLKISACVITKNEEKNIGRWLDCMRQLADDLAGGGVEDGLFLATAALDELAVDVQAEVFVGDGVGDGAVFARGGLIHP